MFLVISCSLNSSSKSRLLAEQAMSVFQTEGKEARLLDLREWNLPYCDGESTFIGTRVAELAEFIAEAEGIILAAPIYCYDVSALTRSLLELAGKAWTEKIVGFLCAAGGQSSYMSVLSVANSLMLDFRCLIVPRFVYATGNAFSENAVSDPTICKRIDELVKKMLFFSSKLLSPE